MGRTTRQLIVMLLPFVCACGRQTPHDETIEQQLEHKGVQHAPIFDPRT